MAEHDWKCGRLRESQSIGRDMYQRHGKAHQCQRLRLCLRRKYRILVPIRLRRLCDWRSGRAGDRFDYLRDYSDRRALLSGVDRLRNNWRIGLDGVALSLPIRGVGK